jgi:hypothetical protein
MTPRSLAPEYFTPTQVTQPLPTLASDYLHRALFVVKALQQTVNLQNGSPVGGQTLNMNGTAVSSTIVAQLTFTNGSYIRVNGGDSPKTVVYNNGTSDTTLYNGTSWTQITVAMPAGSVAVQSITDTDAGWSLTDITYTSTPESKIYECNSRAEVVAITSDNIFHALKSARTDGYGLSQLLVLPCASLADIGDIIDADTHTYFTLYISREFTSEDIAAGNFGEFAGCYAWETTNRAAAKAFNALYNSSAIWIHATAAVGVDAYASYVYGALISQQIWTSLQGLRIPFSSAINNYGLADNAFTDRISFGLDDVNLGGILAFLTFGGVAAHAPYVYEEIIYANQNWNMNFISANRPDFTNANRAILQQYLQRQNDDTYVAPGTVEEIDVEVDMTADNWTFNATIDCSEVKALWRTYVNFRIGAINN